MKLRVSREKAEGKRELPNLFPDSSPFSLFPFPLSRFACQRASVNLIESAIFLKAS
jgi:hypothetical protein